MKKLRIFTNEIIAACVLSTLLCNTAFADGYYSNDKEEELKEKLQSGMTVIEILEEYAETSETYFTPCVITVKSGTELTQVGENDYITPYVLGDSHVIENKYVVYTNDFPAYISQDAFESIEFALSMPPEELKAFNISEMRKQLAEGSDNLMLDITLSDDNDTIENYLLDEDTNWEYVGLNIYLIKGSKEELLKYIDLYENVDIDKMHMIVAQIPGELENELSNDTVYIAGDINNDGKTDLTDITELSLYLIGDKEFSAEQLRSADVDNDGAVKLTDLAKYRQYLSKQIESLL